jgi:arylsulfatase A-like enzyme
MSRCRLAIDGGLAGALASLLLWASDAASLGGLSFAGVSDASVQERLFGIAMPAVVGLEARLVLLHLAAGLLVGALSGLAHGGGAVRRRAVAALTVLALHSIALLGMMGRYPQLYADRFWLAGGARAGLQRFATHVAGPAVFDALFLAALLGLLVAAALRSRAVSRGAAWRLPTVAAGVVGALLWGATSVVTRRQESRTRDDARPDVLLIVVDSLRSDRIESAETMPAVSRLARQGTLFRRAFTPIARTIPSWVSLLTGKEPRHTRVRTMFPDLAALRDLGPTFVSELRDSGYLTFVVSDFAGDMFPRMPAGFDDVDAPSLNAASLARATVLSAHGFALPFLRLPPLRETLAEWRNLASLSDPDWLVDRALAHVGRARGRPFAGVVFLGTPHFPYVAPYPDYLWRSGDYRGRYLYHAPPAVDGRVPDERDVEQVRARYDGAVRATDRAIERLVDRLRLAGTLDRTVLVVTGDHGEELYEEPGIAGHGDTLQSERSQAVPILLRGPGVEASRIRDEQVRLYDLGATLLGLVEGRRGRGLGDGLDLFADHASRPLCVETGIWFFPRLPAGLVGRRLEYPGIAELVEVAPPDGEFVLRREWVATVESYKARGLVLGERLYVEQPTPAGRQEEVKLLGTEVSAGAADVASLFEERCVAGDPSLGRFLGGIVWRGPEP